MRLNTLKKHKEFTAVASVGAKRYSKNFIIFCSDNVRCEQSYSVGFTASKRIGNSVKRNRAKRRMRVLMAHFLQNNNKPITEKLNIIVIAKANMLSEKWDLLVEDFNRTVTSAIFHHSLQQEQSEREIEKNF